MGNFCYYTIFANYPVAFKNYNLDLRFFILMLIRTMPNLTSNSITSMYTIANDSTKTPCPTTIPIPIRRVVNGTQIVSVYTKDGCNCLANYCAIGVCVETHLYRICVLSNVQSTRVVMVVTRRLSKDEYLR